MFKLLAALSVFTLSFAAYSQTSVDLNLCLARLEKAKTQVSDLSYRLHVCQTTPGNSQEEELRAENQRLVAQNVSLQARIDELTGVTKPLPFICSAACVDSSGTLDKRYLELGLGTFQAEADFASKQATQKTYTCNFGIKSYKCEKATSHLPQNFCVAACVDSSGRADERFSAGERGRNMVEAEVLALKSAQKQYKCNFGVKITTCN